jgi:large subunit ribosomal protein L21
MRFAIVESGGKQYRAVEGRTIEVDRLPVDAGKKFDFERVLLMADGDEILVGTPTVSDILVKATVVDHTKGPKIDRFKYRPKKRIRVRGGHRQQYTRLLVDFIGRPGEERKIEKAEPAPVVVEEAPEAEEAPKPKPALGKAEGKQAKAKKEAAATPKEKPAPKKTSAKSATTTKKSTTTRSSSKKTDSKKK